MIVLWWWCDRHNVIVCLCARTLCCTSGGVFSRGKDQRWAEGAHLQIGARPEHHPGHVLPVTPRYWGKPHTDCSEGKQGDRKWNVKRWDTYRVSAEACDLSTRGRTWAAWTKSLSLLKRPRLCSQVTHTQTTHTAPCAPETVWINLCVRAQEWASLLRLSFLRDRWTLCCPSSPARESDSELATRNWSL